MFLRPETDSSSSGGHFCISHFGVTFPLAKVIHQILFWRFSVFWEKGRSAAVVRLISLVECRSDKEMKNRWVFDEQD